MSDFSVFMKFLRAFLKHENAEFNGEQEKLSISRVSVG